MEQLDGKVAVITGAGSGIGAGIARACARAGMKVAVADIRQSDAVGIRVELIAGGADAIAVSYSAIQAIGCRRIALPSMSFGMKAWTPRRWRVGARFNSTGWSCVMSSRMS